MTGYSPDNASDVFSAPVDAPITKAEAPAPEIQAMEGLDTPKDAPKTEEVKPDSPKKQSAADKLRLKKPEAPKEEEKAEQKAQEVPPVDKKEENIRNLRKAKEEWDRVKPEFEKLKGDYTAKETELAATREELAKLKALGLNEQEREEYRRYKDLHAVEAVRNSEEFKKAVSMPIEAHKQAVHSIAQGAKLDQMAFSSLLDAMDIQDKYARNRAIRGIMSNADLDSDTYRDYTDDLCRIASDLNERLYPKEDELVGKAQEIELAAKEREKNQSEEAKSKEMAEFTKERDGLASQLKSDNLKTIFEDTDLSIDGTTIHDAIKDAAIADDAQGRAYQALAGQMMPFVVAWAQKWIDKAHALERANAVRNKSAPSLGDGAPKRDGGKAELNIQDVFGGAA